MIRLANYSPYNWIIYLALKNLLQYDKNMKIIKVKHGTSTFVHFFFLQKFRKINFKNICNTHYSDNTEFPKRINIPPTPPYQVV